MFFDFRKRMGSRRSEAKKVRRVIYPRSFLTSNDRLISWDTIVIVCIVYSRTSKTFSYFQPSHSHRRRRDLIWCMNVPCSLQEEKECIIHGCRETILLCCCLGTLCSRRQTAFCFHNCSFLVFFSYVLYYTQDILSLFFLFSFAVSSHNMCEPFVHFHANILRVHTI